MSQALSEKPRELTPATTRTTFVRYIDRTREHYEAQGFERPYRWAYHQNVPLTPLNKPLSESVVSLITTANEPSPPGWKVGDPRPLRRVHSFSSGEPPSLYTDDLSWHKEVTNTDDLDSFLPVHRLAELVEEGRIGSLAPRCHGVPTEYSQRRTVENDAPEILRRCREDGADVVILVPLWPVCHQSVSLTARHLEANGLPTVILGSARDIVEHCGVPRFVFNDFPLGNSAGLPWQPAMQRGIVELGLELLESARQPRTTVQSPFVWPGDPDWRDSYSRVDDSNREALRAKGERRRAQRERDRAEGNVRAE